MTLCFANSHFVNVMVHTHISMGWFRVWEPKFKLEFEPFSEFTTLTIIQE